MLLSSLRHFSKRQLTICSKAKYPAGFQTKIELMICWMAESKVEDATPQCTYLRSRKSEFVRTALNQGKKLAPFLLRGSLRFEVAMIRPSAAKKPVMEYFLE